MHSQSWPPLSTFHQRQHHCISIETIISIHRKPVNRFRYHTSIRQTSIPRSKAISNLSHSTGNDLLRISYHDLGNGNIQVPAPKALQHNTKPNLGWNPAPSAIWPSSHTATLQSVLPRAPENLALLARNRGSPAFTLQIILRAFSSRIQPTRRLTTIRRPYFAASVDSLRGK